MCHTLILSPFCNLSRACHPQPDAILWCHHIRISFHVPQHMPQRHPWGNRPDGGNGGEDEDVWSLESRESWSIPFLHLCYIVLIHNSIGRCVAASLQKWDLVPWFQHGRASPQYPSSCPHNHMILRQAWFWSHRNMSTKKICGSAAAFACHPYAPGCNSREERQFAQPQPPRQHLTKMETNWNLLQLKWQPWESYGPKGR